MTTAVTASSAEAENATKQNLYDLWRDPQLGEYPPREVVETVFAHGFADDMSLGIGQVEFDQTTRQSTWTCTAVTERALIRVTAIAVSPDGDIWSSTRQGRSAVEYVEYPTVKVATTPLSDLAGLEVAATGDISAWRPERGVRRVWSFRFNRAEDFELTTNQADRAEHPNISALASFLAARV